MGFLIVNRAKDMVGAHATTMLVNDFVNARLGSYGQAVEEVCVTLLYSGRSSSTGSLEAEFQRLVRLSPRVTFFRTKRRIEVRSVCRGVSAASISGDGHLTPEELAHLVSTVTEALELIRLRIRPADQFDVDRFLADAQDALARCPGAIRRWMR